LFETGIPLLKERLQQLPDADNVSILQFFSYLSFIFRSNLKQRLFFISWQIHIMAILIFLFPNFLSLLSGSYCISRWWCLEAIPQAVRQLFSGWSPLSTNDRYIQFLVNLFIVVWIFGVAGCMYKGTWRWQEDSSAQGRTCFWSSCSNCWWFGSIWRHLDWVSGQLWISELYAYQLMCIFNAT
jgi:hypothetical protein